MKIKNYGKMYTARITMKEKLATDRQILTDKKEEAGAK